MLTFDEKFSLKDKGTLNNKQRKTMKTLFTVLGWISLFIAFVGGIQVMAREGIHSYTVVAFLFFILVAILCFWGANRFKKKESD